MATAKSAPEFTFDQGDVRNISEKFGEPAWLLEQRLQAWEHFQTLPMPTLKDEAWRRTDLRGLSTDTLTIKPATDTPVDADLQKPLISGKQDWFLARHPGHPSEEVGGEKLKALGVILADWATAIRDQSQLLERHLGGIVSHEEGKFAALSSAMAEEGILLYIPPGLEIEEPLHSVLWTPGSGAFHSSRLLIVVGKGASCTFVHEMASPTESVGQSLHTGVVEILVEEDASLTFVELQSLGQHVWNFTHERAHVKQYGRLNWIYGGVGSRLTKNFSELNLLGEGGEAKMSAFYFVEGNQHMDHDTQQNHLAPHTTSDLLFKGALVDKSRSVWQGMIYVAPGAQKTDGYQANRNLILSREARADSIPGLEILADDVRCTHGATIGQLEEEPIFYLMSRGLPRWEAERLVINGFFDPIMQRIPFEGVRDRFKRVIEAKTHSD
jgi:Fe-S cluster assembly protein SufD